MKESISSKDPVHKGQSKSEGGEQVEEIKGERLRTSGLTWLVGHDSTLENGNVSRGSVRQLNVGGGRKMRVQMGPDPTATIRLLKGVLARRCEMQVHASNTCIEWKNGRRSRKHGQSSHTTAEGCPAQCPLRRQLVRDCRKTTPA